MPRIAALRLTRHPDGVATTATPTLGWAVEADAPGWVQAWAELRDGTGAVQRIAGRDAVTVAWPFAPLEPRERRTVQVRAASSAGDVTRWRDPLEVRAGFLADSGWHAAFIGPPDPERIAQPALLRHGFGLDEALGDVLFGVPPHTLEALEAALACR